jgi:uncharacterized membrane protein YfcA
MAEIIGYVCTVVAGLLMGLLGGGGSILTVPIFAYLFHMPAHLATGYSLFVVGITSLVGAVSYYAKGKIDVKAGLCFALPSLIGVYISRRWILNALPDIVWQSPTVTKDQLILSVFALLMLGASMKMLRNQKVQTTDGQLSFWHIGVFGLMTGLFIGFVGAGGGFIIVPALVLLARLDMKTAVGTSLMIIFLNASVGLIGDLQSGLSFQWTQLWIFCGLTITGLLTGLTLNKHISGQKLKKGFGFFVLLFAVGMLCKELFL